MGSIIGVAQVAQSIAVSLHPLHQHIIVLTGSIIAPAGLAFPVHCLSEVIEGAGIGSRPVELDLLVRPFRTDLIPLGEFALSLRFPDFFQIGDLDRVHPVILAVHHHRQGIISNGEFQVFNPTLLGRFDFLLLDGTARILHISLTPSELFKSPSGARNADRYLRPGRLLKLLCHSLRDRVDRAGTIDFDYLLSPDVTGYGSKEPQSGPKKGQ